MSDKQFTLDVNDPTPAPSPYAWEGSMNHTSSPNAGEDAINPPQQHKLQPRMTLRGRLDSLNAQIIFLQTLSGNPAYISDLEAIRAIVRQLQACEAGGKIFDSTFTLWGLDEDEIHTRSHNPAKYYGLGHIMPHHDMQREAASINLLRTLVREAELSACQAFPDDTLRICHVLNRLSSALYILTYKYLPADYEHELTFSKA